MAVVAESKPDAESCDSPPKVPPRTKRRSKPTNAQVQESNPDREVLVAVTKGPRDRKAESRQRQPPAMLMRQDSEQVQDQNEEPAKEKPRRGPHLLVLPPNKGPRLYHPMHPSMRIVPVQPMSVTYGNWIRKVGPGDPEINGNILRRIFGPHVILRPVKVSTGRGGYPAKTVGSPTVNNTNTNSSSNSKSVTRSGSLSSQGSVGSDSGNDSRPKSALKKVRRGCSEPKKCVTFNALTTVQVMEE